MKLIQNICRIFMGFCFSSLLIIYTGSILDIRYRFITIFLVLILTALFYWFISLMTKEFHITDIGFWGLVIISCILYYWTLRRPGISWDTWQVYDMSRYIFKDFGYMQTIRQHIVNTHYEMAFPPIFPFLMAATNLFLDMGIMSSVLLNFIFFLALICILKNIGDYTGQRMAFAIASIAFVCTPLFRTVFRGGLTQILGFLIFAIIMRLILKQDFIKKDCFMCAFMSGLGLMNRFDFLAVAGIISFLAPFRVKQSVKITKRFIWIFIDIIIVTSVSFPWIIYSLIHFGKIFVTDNGRRLINIVDTRPSTYFSTDHPALTLFDDNKAWFIAFKSRCMGSIDSLKDLINDYYIFKYFAWITIGVSIIFLLCKLIRKKDLSFRKLGVILNKYSGIIIIACAVSGYEILIILTGYADSRYHILFLFLINLWVLTQFGVMITCGLKTIKRRYTSIVKKIIVSLVLLLLFMTFIYDGYRTLQKNQVYILSQKLSGPDTISKAISLSEEEARIDDYLYEQNAACLLLYRQEETVKVPRICSLIHSTTIISPSNISTENAAEFVEDFDIDYIYSSDTDFNNILFDAVECVETPVEHLYRVEKILSEYPHERKMPNETL